MQALAGCPELHTLSLHWGGLSCPPHLLEGGFSKLTRLHITTPPLEYRCNDFLTAMTAVEFVEVTSEECMAYHSAEDDPWRVLRDIAVLACVTHLHLTPCDTGPGDSGDLEFCLKSMPQLLHFDACGQICVACQRSICPHPAAHCEISV